jgi:hypothetical protein
MTAAFYQHDQLETMANCSKGIQLIQHNHSCLLTCNHNRHCNGSHRHAAARPRRACCCLFSLFFVDGLGSTEKHSMTGMVR